MDRNNQNAADGVSLEFPRSGFWLLHMFGIAIIFLLGMRFATKHTPVPLFALLKLLRKA